MGHYAAERLALFEHVHVGDSEHEHAGVDLVMAA
jgi:hypothetical protein